MPTFLEQEKQRLIPFVQKSPYFSLRPAAAAAIKITITLSVFQTTSPRKTYSPKSANRSWISSQITTSSGMMVTTENPAITYVTRKSAASTFFIPLPTNPRRWPPAASIFPTLSELLL